MAYKADYKVIIVVGDKLKEFIVTTHSDRDSVLETACRVDENMGGDFMNIVYCDLV